MLGVEAIKVLLSSKGTSTRAVRKCEQKYVLVENYAFLGASFIYMIFE